MSNIRYNKNDIERVRQLAHLTNKEIADRLKLKENQVIYIKQQYSIYKTH